MSLPVGGSRNAIDSEAQRILTVVNLTISRFEVLCAVLRGDLAPPEIMAKKGKNSLRDYQNLMDTMKTIDTETDPDSQQEARETMRVAIKNLCRAFSSELSTPSAPTIASGSNLATMANSLLKPNGKTGTMSVIQAEQLSYIRQLLTSTRWLMIERLTRSAHDEEANRIELIRATDREKRLSDDVSIQQALLAKAMSSRASEIGAKNEIIEKLKEQLRQIKQGAEDVINKMEIRTKQKEESELSSFNTKQEAFETELGQLTVKLKELQVANREEELQLRKKTQKVEADVESWIQKYDTDMDEKQNEIDQVSALYKEELYQLETLRKKYSENEIVNIRISEYHKVAEDLKRRRNEHQREKDKAATKIQAAFRGFKSRRQLQKDQLREKKKKKSTKGKKKGKKKK